MKIISKYKDYYDAGLIYGIDEKIYFKREQKKQQIELNFEGYIFGFKNDENVYEITIFPGIIGFCGDFFPLYTIYIKKTFKGIITNSKEIAYKYDDFIKIFQNIGFKIITTKIKYGLRSKEEVLVINDEILDISIDKIKLFLEGYSDEWGKQGEKKIIQNIKIYFMMKK